MPVMLFIRCEGRYRRESGIISFVVFQQEYLRECLANLERVKFEEEQEREREERWSSTWQLSMDRVRQLYN